MLANNFLRHTNTKWILPCTIEYVLYWHESYKKSDSLKKSMNTIEKQYYSSIINHNGALHMHTSTWVDFLSHFFIKSIIHFLYTYSGEE